MSVRYTDAEKLILKRAHEAIADPNTSDWHRRRFEGDIKRVKEAAAARAAEREKRAAVPPPPSGVNPQSHAEERQRAKDFMAALNAHLKTCAGCPQCHGGVRVVESGAVVAKPKAADAAPQAADILAGVESFTICPSCLISTEFCGHNSKHPAINLDAIVNAHDRAEKFSAERKAQEEEGR